MTGGLNTMKNKKEAGVWLCFWKGLEGEEGAVSVEERHAAGGKSNCWGSEAGRCKAITQHLVLGDGCAMRQHEQVDSSSGWLGALSEQFWAKEPRDTSGNTAGGATAPREGEGPTVQGGIWVWGQSLQHLCSLLQPGPEAAVRCEEKGLRTKGKQERVSSSSRRPRDYRAVPNTPEVLLRHPDWAGVPANLAWLRRARCGGQASTTGSLEKPQAPERPVFRFQAFRALSWIIPAISL